MSYYWPQPEKPPGMSGVYGSVPMQAGPYGMQAVQAAQQNGLPSGSPSSQPVYRSPTPPYGSALAAAANPTPVYAPSACPATVYGSTLQRSPYASTTPLMPSSTLAYSQVSQPSLALSHNPYMGSSLYGAPAGVLGGSMGAPTVSRSYPGGPAPQPSGLSAPTARLPTHVYPSSQYSSAQYGLGLPSPTLSPISGYPQGPMGASVGSYPMGTPGVGVGMGVPSRVPQSMPANSYPGAAAYARPIP